MELVLNALDWPLLMDILALGTSGVLIGMLTVNRVRYGHLVGAPSSAPVDFASEMTLQMVTQQSQRSYRKIQQALDQEFADLQRLTTGTPSPRQHCQSQPHTADKGPDAGEAGRHRPHVYDQAVRMIDNGVDPQDIARRCGLAHSEIDLMAYMQQRRPPI